MSALRRESHAPPARVISDSHHRVRIFDLVFDAVDEQVATALIGRAARDRMRGLVITPNADHIVLISRDPVVGAIFRSASFLFADGMPIVWLSRLLPGRRLPGRVTGADLLMSVCRHAAELDLSVYFLGGRPGASELVRRRFSTELPRLRVVGTDCPPYGFDDDPAATERILQGVNAVRPDILFLGFGTPKQERWIAAHLHHLDVGPVLCVGASLDFAAGLVRRAPVLLRRIGLEWAWRLALEPRRLWRRYLLRDTQFFAIALREWRERRAGGASSSGTNPPGG